MLSEEEIKQVLRAKHVVPMPPASPHGPIGWEHLAHIMAQYLESADTRVRTIAAEIEIPDATKGTGANS